MHLLFSQAVRMSEFVQSGIRLGTNVFKETGLKNEKALNKLVFA